MLIFLMFLNLYYYNIFLNPIKQMIFLIIYTILLSFYMYTYMCSYLYSMLILIVYISGVMILFSYFISLLNISMKNNFKMLMFMIMTMILIILIIYYLMNNLNIKLFNDNLLYIKFMKIYYLYFYSNIIFLFMLIMFLIMMLYLSFKICFLKKKSLRKL
uniref:NADH dehydrogenase subunit 6 n=1 Tax=Nomada flava TaxID=601523 RepID=A0A0S2LTQ3_9HYME|nr:NADH dehydrogenase subunit 6 [Nomada flava]